MSLDDLVNLPLRNAKPKGNCLNIKKELAVGIAHRKGYQPQHAPGLFAPEATNIIEQILNVNDYELVAVIARARNPAWLLNKALSSSQTLRVLFLDLIVKVWRPILVQCPQNVG